MRGVVSAVRRPTWRDVQGGRALSFLLDRIQPDLFISKYWGKRPLHVRGRRRHFSVLFGQPWREDRGRAARVELGALRSNGKFQKVDGTVEQIDVAFAAGMTIASEVKDSGFLAFLAELQKDLGVPGPFVAKVFESRDKAGFAAHWDEMHALVLQCEGKKRWHVSKQPLLTYPTRSALFDSNKTVQLAGEGIGKAPTAANQYSVVLQPGDFLYIPPGTWHRAEALGYSMAVSIYPELPRIHEFTATLFARRFRHEPGWRNLLPAVGESSASGDLSPELRALFRAKLDEMRETLDHIDEYDLYRELIRQVTMVAPPPASVHRSDRVSRLTYLQHDGQLRFMREGGKRSGEVSLISGDFEASLPAAGLPLVRWLVSHRLFQARDAVRGVRGLAWRSVQSILGALVRKGILRTASTDLTPSGRGRWGLAVRRSSKRRLV